MHVRTLQVFCDVVAHRSFSEAAKENGLSQPHVSQLMQQLEEELGVVLLDRSRRPLVLTAQGRLFYEGCRALVDRYTSLVEEVRTLHDEISGQVRVAAIYSVGLGHLTERVKAFLGQHPRSNVRVEYQHPEQVYELVEQDRVDLGLVSYPRSTRKILATPWHDEPMVVVCGPDHALAGRASVWPADLHGMEMVAFDAGLPIREETDRFLADAGVEVVVTMAFDNTETLKGAIEIGAGFGILPLPTVSREIAAGSLVAIPFAKSTLVRPVGIITRRGRSQSKTTRRFIQFLLHSGKSDSPPDRSADASVRAVH
jgi:DNA-binding transcriptional LysR family regulator